VFIEHKVQIWVRRAGPNYQEGLKNIKNVGQELKLDMHVYGPECMKPSQPSLNLRDPSNRLPIGHVSGIVPMALLGKNPGNIQEYSG